MLTELYIHFLNAPIVCKAGWAACHCVPCTALGTEMPQAALCQDSIASFETIISQHCAV